MNNINRVAIVGGVHGNELLGIYLVKKFQQDPQIIARDSFDVITLLANTQAIKLSKRYIDIDLNRCFDSEDLNNSNLTKYEQILAKKIFQQLQNSQVDFLIDIHTSTANMGMTLLLSNLLPFNLNLAAYLISLDPTIKIVYSQNNGDGNRLRNVFQYGFTIEIGSIPHRVLDPIWFQKTETLIINILNYIELFNRGKIIYLPPEITLYSSLIPINFPVDDRGQLMAMVHPSLQGKDYCELHPEQPMFLKLDGSNILYQGSQTVYPLFINESAYWEKNLAMYLTSKQTIKIKQL